MLEVELYTPHPAQRLLHDSRARFRIATCGRRFGKTMACVNELAKHALEHKGHATAWIAPYYPQARIAFRWLCREFRDAFAEPPSLSDMRVHWRGDSTSQFFSADNFDAIRGHGFDFLVGDEFASWVREAWESAVRPTLSDKSGRAILVGTPRGRNLFYELWIRGQDRERWPDYESWQFPSSANPYYPPGEIEEVRQSLPTDVFSQEYEAQFLEDSAGVFRNLNACERGTLEPWNSDHEYVLGWDPAKHADASVATIFDTTTHRVVAWERMLKTDYVLQLERIARMAREYHAFVLMDSTGVGDPLLEQLIAREVPADGFTFTNQTKQQLVEFLAVEIEQGRVSWPATLRPLRNELEVFQYEVTRAGNVRYAAPEGHHDDCVMSLGLAVWAGRHYGAGAPLASHLAAEPYAATDWGSAP